MALPEWKLKVLGLNKLGIICPRCKNKAIVAKTQWFETRHHCDGTNDVITTRPCPYCFRANQVPDD